MQFKVIKTEFSGNATVENNSDDAKDRIYLLMNKPCGYVCSSVSDSHKTVYSLLPPSLQTLVTSPKRGFRLHTVGRLDCDTSGLLLFTTDGQFSNYLTRSENHIVKEYSVVLEKAEDEKRQEEIAAAFEKGVVLPAEKKALEETALPAKVSFLGAKECRVWISEGKFHQVRRMFAAVNNQVASLERVSIGSLQLPSDLLPGQYKMLSLADLHSFELY